jgi:uncharacterized protein Yka (UPF0111/DUF47 family)
MFSLQKLLGKDDKFFTLMEGSAEESRASIHSLIEIVKKPEDKRTMEGFIAARREDKRITKELTEHLCKTFVTPLEREDIEALSHALYKIPKVAEKFAERVMIAPHHMRGLQLEKHLAMLEQAADTVVLMVKELRKGVNIETVQKQNDKLQNIEGEADGLMLETLRDLYNGDHSVIKVVVLKDLFEILEKVFDRCRDVGNIVFQIVLKHS